MILHIHYYSTLNDNFPAHIINLLIHSFIHALNSVPLTITQRQCGVRSLPKAPTNCHCWESNAHTKHRPFNHSKLSDFFQFFIILLFTDAFHSSQNEIKDVPVTTVHCKAILGLGQPGLMRWILTSRIMPQVQDTLLNLLTCSPVHYYYATTAPLTLYRELYCHLSQYSVHL